MRNFLYKYPYTFLFVCIYRDGKERAEFVPTSKINARFPQKVIEYYEAHLRFTTNTKDK